MNNEDETETKLSSLPTCAGEFVRLVIKKMRYRRKVRADVMAELAAHFEDELKDCANDEEREQKAQRLIDEFGDTKLLAVLLRRAKKRCRPLWRTAVARTFQTAGILILCLVVYVIWFLSGKPVITVDYVAELNRIVRPVTDESLNAAPLYNKAAKLYGEKPSDDYLLFFAANCKDVVDKESSFGEWLTADEIKELFSNVEKPNFNEEKLRIWQQVVTRLSILLKKKYHEVTVGEKKFIEKWLLDRQQALEAVLAGSKKPYYWREYSNNNEESGVMGILLPSLSEFRKLAWALLWRAQLRTEQGQYEDTIENITSCYRLGKHIKNEDGFLVEQLVGMAIEALAVQVLRDILGEHEMDSTTLTKLQDDFEQMIDDEDFTVSFKFEKLAMYDVIQRCFTEDRLGGGHLSLEGGFKLFRVLEGLSPIRYDGDVKQRLLTSSLHILFTHPNKQESREMADHCYAFWEKIVPKTPAQIQAENIDIEKRTMELFKGNILLEIFAPDFGRINEVAHRRKTEVEATLTIIALLRYQQDTGSYPESLEELITAGYLEELPLDSFSDKPMVYRRTNGNFLLYSVGLNFIDDGGKLYRTDIGRPRPWADEGDAVFWPVTK
ncbi:MAG: hypothetical protein JSW23_04565 [Planctomycetota bacterium]|nr:MAG: hypothetical protein JSW23_04565 [Planctomycetota bacterium]